MGVFGNSAFKEPLDFFDEPRLYHPVDAGVDAGVELLPGVVHPHREDGKAGDALVVLFGLALSREFVYFERADDALFVVGVQHFGGGGVDFLKTRKERLFPLPLEYRLVLLSNAFICGRAA